MDCLHGAAKLFSVKVGLQINCTRPVRVVYPITANVVCIDSTMLATLPTYT